MRERIQQRLRGDAPPADSDAGSQAADNGLPFDYRVRVLVEIQEDPDELALAESQLTARGWPVREPKPGEYAPGEVTPSYVPRIVEVRLIGARDGAAQHALHQVMDLSYARELALHVRDAALIQHRPDPHITWKLHPKRVPTPRERLKEWLGIESGGTEEDPQPERVIRIPEDAPEADALAAAASHSPAWPPFDPLKHEVRPARINSAPPIALAHCLSAAAAVAIAYLAIRYLPIGGDSWWADMGVGLVLGIGGALSSRLVAGIVFIYRQSTALRAVLPWALPVVVPTAFAAIPQVGQSMYAGYLSAFDLSGEVSTGAWPDGLMAGAWVSAAFLYGLLAGIGASGWVYRTTARSGTAFGTAVLIGMYVGALTGWLLAAAVTDRAADSGENARAAVTEYKTPGAYYGLKANFTCVRPKEKDAPVYGGTLPADRPLLTFGPKGDRVSLWDPKTKRALSMRLEDASFVPAKSEHGKAVCPRTK
ncbi:hypothetical protein OG453_00385 [Streptomyces sp. NBC_01381]|uniref:hypothetical protein n=1 Tax=Streptomyces sp. NBC_01381 TaxID=2903845 RepID=UPI002254437A|nr:hypothetical protein [Streptomyces sp. NBC_01381]MCX4665142.1 hypothetical protein [Streptomyces sp. NBC_01381]